MSEIINFKEVSVRYRTTPSGVHSFKDLLTSFSNPFSSTVILKDISFTLNKGESLGILGRNGSGKSTLLRCVAGIISPYEGIIKVNATIAPILALGAGLELELTGYENIKLLLAIYGCPVTKEAIASITSFSELSHEALNQATKCYSSGMLARLSFSISFYQESEIYIIDEVMAVGDLGFQEKCMQRINELQHNGKSIIFVSHFPDEVERICDQAILLDNGRLILKSTSHEVCNQYKKMF